MEIESREGCGLCGPWLDSFEFEEFKNNFEIYLDTLRPFGWRRIENACGGNTGRSLRILAFVKVFWESESACVVSAPAVPGACCTISGSEVKDGFVGRFYYLLVAS